MPATPFRMALGALIIKETLGISDIETVQQIKENPYRKYFIGMPNYSNDSPFKASMMVYFREGIKMDFVKIKVTVNANKTDLSNIQGISSLITVAPSLDFPPSLGDLMQKLQLVH